MFRIGLVAVLLLGLGSTAMASDRVRVSIGVDGYYGDVDYRFSYVGGGRDYGRWDSRYPYYRDGYYGRAGRYYSAPRGYYYYPRPNYRPYSGYSRGAYGNRYSRDYRGHDRYDGRRDGRRWHHHH